RSCVLSFSPLPMRLQQLECGTLAAKLNRSSDGIDDDSMRGVVRAAELPEEAVADVSALGFANGKSIVILLHMSNAETVYYCRMESPAGKLLLAATGEGLRFLLFDKGQALRKRKDEVWIESQEKLRPYQGQLQAYF